MIPKKAKDYIAIQAKKEGIPEQDLEEMVISYWKELRESVTSLKHNKILINGLGHFKTSFTKMAEALHRENDAVLKMDGRFPDIIVDKHRVQRDRLDKLIGMHKEEWEREKVIKQMKQEHRRKKENK